MPYIVRFTFFSIRVANLPSLSHAARVKRRAAATPTSAGFRLYASAYLLALAANLSGSRAAAVGV